MLLTFTSEPHELVRTTKFDGEMAIFSDRHYSRQTPGSNQFMPPGETLVLRNPEGTILFGWVYQRPEFRDDKQVGICCSIFRNEAARLSSDVIVEAEQWAIREWQPSRFFTYIDPKEITSPNPGYCFKQAGWHFVHRCKDGKHLLAKELP